MELLQLLESRIKEAGLKITFNPPGDGLCFYAAAGHQLGLSAETVRDRVFEFLEKNRYDRDDNDRMDFISDVDIGHVEKPSSWSDALAVLKENYATSMVVRAFADCFQRIVYVVTANGEDNYIKVFEPQFKSTAEYIYLGHTGIHYMALAPFDKIQQGKKGVEVQKEELLPYAEACETRGKRINFIDPSISSDADTPSTSSTSSTSTKRQVIPDKTDSPVSCKKKKNLPTTASEAGDSTSNLRSDVVQRCQEHFNRIYPSLDKSRTVMCPPIFQYDYKAPTEEKAAGYSKSMKKIEHTIKGDEAEQSVFRALADSDEPMFVIRDLQFSPFLQSIVNREITKKEYRQLDFVIIHWNIGVLLVEVKHKDSRNNYRKGMDELANGERIIKDVIAALQSQQHIDSYDKNQNHVDEHLTDQTNVIGKTTVCQTQDDVHAVKVQTQANASRDTTATIEAVRKGHTQADTSVKEMKDHGKEPVQKGARTQIPVYKIYAAPNDEPKNVGSTCKLLDSSSLKNIPDWLKSNCSIGTFNEDHQELLHKLCSVLVGQKTEITTTGSQIRFSDQVLRHKLQQQIHGAIDSQSFLKQSYEKDCSKKKKNQERNVVSTRDRDQPHLSILAEQFLFLNKEQLAVWEGPLHQIIDGTPGSGKTILLMYKALECARKGEKVRVYGPPKLRPLYEKFFQDHGIHEDIATFESFGEEVFGIYGFCSNEQTCHVFIDEFQLSVNQSTERNLELLLEKLPKKALMYYWIACNQMQPFGLGMHWNDLWQSGQIQKLLTWLPELQRLGFHRKLNTCVRNTRNIQDFVEWCMEYVGVSSTLPEEIRSVHPGHNIHGDRVNVYFVEKKYSDVRGESDKISKDNLPPSAAFSGTIPQSELDDEPYNGIAETIKKEIESCSSSQKCAVFVSFFRNWTKMLEAMFDQDIQVSFDDPLSDSDQVYVSHGMDVHSYEWDTVVAMCELSDFFHNYVVFTRAISKLVVIFYTSPAEATEFDP